MTIFTFWFVCLFLGASKAPSTVWDISKEDLWCIISVHTNKFSDMWNK